REIELPPLPPLQPDAFGGYRKIYLRFDDIADDARIYLNGHLIGTQTSVEKRLDWVAENGSRHHFGVPVEKGITWQHFERVGLPFPFDKNAVPRNANRAVLPLYSGQEEWPSGYDVSDIVKEGRNTIAIRAYGNPVRGWWIYRHRDDRSAQNIYGILGHATLAIQPHPLIAAFSREPATTVRDDGQATHHFTCELLPERARAAHTVVFRCGEITINVSLSPSGKATADIDLPARFGNHTVQAAVLDAKGTLLETRAINFDGSVIEVTKNRRLLVNGEPFLVRGINAGPGVEWNNDRRVTKREFLRTLRLYQQLGLNTLRMEPAEDWQIQVAFEYGFMVMPTTAASSTNWSMGAFGQLVEPDLRLALDRQRLMTIQQHRHANILLWNGGNEIHHTPGYDDRPVLERYIEGIRDAFRAHDPVRRPVTYANLDMWRQNWFFLEGQDVIGWNTYKNADDLRAELPAVLAAAQGRPLLFTEWGMEKQSSRRDNIDQWEKEMRGKWDLLSTTPGSIGGMIFAWHGELDDARGRQFLQDLFLPFELTQKNGQVLFKNRSGAAMNAVTFTLITGDQEVPLADLAHSVSAGSTYETRFLTRPPTGSTLEIRYETHGGLHHFFTKKL
ncbi:MAG: hypothetical protein LBK99_03890, partial [Opitutaceae bacterium]|nr:hypothetical protein [Opitutaceae bacterium]